MSSLIFKLITVYLVEIGPTLMHGTSNVLTAQKIVLIVRQIF